MTKRYWINTITLDHVLAGVRGGFTQANHGSDRILKRLSKGDGVLFYSPRPSLDSNEPLQEFTALGSVTDDEPYQVEQTPEFRPFRRNLDFADILPVPIRPLIGQLTFIRDPTHWGMPFRLGLFEIPEEDFDLISGAMRK